MCAYSRLVFAVPACAIKRPDTIYSLCFWSAKSRNLFHFLYSAIYAAGLANDRMNVSAGILTPCAFEYDQQARLLIFVSPSFVSLQSRRLDAVFTGFAVSCLANSPQCLFYVFQ